MNQDGILLVILLVVALAGVYILFFWIPPEYRVCHWTNDENEDYNTWHGECGWEWDLDDGTPKENGIIFCPSCGRPLVQVIQSIEGGGE